MASACDGLLGRFPKGVATAPDCLDIVQTAARIGELFSELADKDINDLGFRLVHAAIKMVEKHFLRQRRTFAEREEFQNLIFLASDVKSNAMQFHTLRVEVDDEVCYADVRLGMPL